MFKLKLFFVGILKVNDEKSRIRIQDPDPLVRGMDPRIRIHSKMSWIWNTAGKHGLLSLSRHVRVYYDFAKYFILRNFILTERLF
jgi:hypothetical protein